MVSVMAVKTQFNSPSGVLRSETRPGIPSNMCGVTRCVLNGFLFINQRSAILIGVCEEEENTKICKRKEIEEK